jgi:uncharacterized membrane protein YhaH (DUF805 family)
MKWFFEVLKKYAVFSGRARRKEYWYFILFYILIMIVIATIATLMGLNTKTIDNVYALVFFIPNLAVSVRRMHDVGKSGWYCIIPIYNLILACTNGTVGPNEYGPDPKGGILYGADDYERPFDAIVN